LPGDGCDQHCVASQAVRPVAVRPQPIAEKPANGGLLQFAGGLQTPNFRSCRPKMPKVSGHSLNNSRFPETPAGDWVRSAAVVAGKLGRPGPAVPRRYRRQTLRFCRQEKAKDEVRRRNVQRSSFRDSFVIGECSSFLRRGARLEISCGAAARECLVHRKKKLGRREPICPFSLSRLSASQFVSGNSPQVMVKRELKLSYPEIITPAAACLCRGAAS
jgi:hypothetical protein